MAAGLHCSFPFGARLRPSSGTLVILHGLKSGLAPVPATSPPAYWQRRYVPKVRVILPRHLRAIGLARTAPPQMAVLAGRVCRRCLCSVARLRLRRSVKPRPKRPSATEADTAPALIVWLAAWWLHRGCHGTCLHPSGCSKYTRQPLERSLHGIGSRALSGCLIYSPICPYWLSSQQKA